MDLLGSLNLISKPFVMNNIFAASFGLFLIHPALLYAFKGRASLIIDPIDPFIVSLRLIFPRFMFKVT